VTPDPRLRAGLALLFSVIVVGTGGYVLIEDMAFVDAFYMTAITVSTVGFGEVGGELGDGGKVFTVGVIIFGMGGALYTAAVGIERGVDRLLGGVGKQRRMEGQIEQLKGHIVLCGFGRVGSKA
jgi:voltage-gated potassium channel